MPKSPKRKSSRKRSPSVRYASPKSWREIWSDAHQRVRNKFSKPPTTSFTPPDNRTLLRKAKDSLKMKRKKRKH